MSDDLDAATTWARGLIARWPGESSAHHLTALVNAAEGTRPDTGQAHEPVVTVDGPECDHAPRTGGACLPCAVKYWEAECDRLREELSQADTFGRGEFRVTTWAYEQAVRTMNEAKAEVERLRARTHEIQAQEMAKRADLDREVAEWRQRYAAAREWTEIEGLTADWAIQRPSSGYHPFWSTTSYNMRSTLLRLVTERDEALAEVERLRPEPSADTGQARELQAIIDELSVFTGCVIAGTQPLSVEELLRRREQYIAELADLEAAAATVQASTSGGVSS